MHGRMTLAAYYHNEAAAGKDVCNSHTTHQQARIEACIAEGTWWDMVGEKDNLQSNLLKIPCENKALFSIHGSKDSPQ